MIYTLVLIGILLLLWLAFKWIQEQFSQMNKRIWSLQVECQQIKKAYATLEEQLKQSPPSQTIRQRYDKLFNYLDQGKSLEEISRLVHMPIGEVQLIVGLEIHQNSQG